MKAVFIALVSLSLLSGCTKKESDKLFKMRVENNLINGCMGEVEKVTQLDKYRSDFRNYCNCSAEAIFKTYSLDELRDLDKETDKVKLLKLGMESSKSCLHVLDNAVRDFQK